MLPEAELMFRFVSVTVTEAPLTVAAVSETLSHSVLFQYAR